MRTPPSLHIEIQPKLTVRTLNRIAPRRGPSQQRQRV